MNLDGFPVLACCEFSINLKFSRIQDFSTLRFLFSAISYALILGRPSFGFNGFCPKGMRAWPRLKRFHLQTLRKMPWEWRRDSRIVAGNELRRKDAGGFVVLVLGHD